MCVGAHYYELIGLDGHGLAIAPATYYAAKTRPPSPRAVADAATTRVIERVHAAAQAAYLGMTQCNE